MILVCLKGTRILKRSRTNVLMREVAYLRSWSGYQMRQIKTSQLQWRRSRSLRPVEQKETQSNKTLWSKWNRSSFRKWQQRADSEVLALEATVRLEGVCYKAPRRSRRRQSEVNNHTIKTLKRYPIISIGLVQECTMLRRILLWTQEGTKVQESNSVIMGFQKVHLRRSYPNIGLLITANQRCVSSCWRKVRASWWNQASPNRIWEIYQRW